ncbi:TIGR03617 family F420-dependent LLM class oxidoreductase [bacterium]|nr:TIGR03617 family F420-dependent LLM class oxidoreductase [bacterium]
MKTETLLPLGKLDPGLAAPDAPLDVTQIASQANTVDQLGYQTLLMEETKDDLFQVLALAAAGTQRVRLGTSVSIAFARSPYVTAMSAWTLQKLSHGRFELGLGSQVSGHLRRRFGMQWHPPGPWMRDYVNAVKSIWHSWQSETPLRFTSTHYNLNLTVPLFTPGPIHHPKIPIQVAAVNPYMCGIAAEVADGVRLHPVCSPTYIKQTLKKVIDDHRGDDSPFEICLKPLIASAADSDTLAERTEIARARLAFYVSTPAYRRPFAQAGLEDLAIELSALSKAQRWTEMAGCISDDVLHQWVLVARYDDLASAVKKRFAGLIQRIEIGIPVNSEKDHRCLEEILTDIHAI